MQISTMDTRYQRGKGQALFGTGRLAGKKNAAEGFESHGEALNSRRQEGLLRVAAYIRVSTDQLCQEESFEQQEQYFSRLIRETSGWEYAGIYSDHGISGTQKDGRLGFLRLLRHCEEGYIDRILCKSISRFTRNTQDLLEAVRILGRRGISIVFEKENIDTAEPVNEFVLTTLAALAQEESRSISENMKTGIRMRFSKGEVFFNPIYGYRVYKNRDSKGNLIRDVVVEPGEAEVVRYIYRSVIEGRSYTEIARTLNRRLIAYPSRRTVTRGRKGSIESPDCGWTGERVAAVLKTERYTGDAICQKTCKQDLLSHRDVKNTGQLPRYVVRNNHPAIVSREEYAAVQDILEKRKHKKRDNTEYVYSGRIVCGGCGRVYHLRSQSGTYRSWQCPCTTCNTHARLVCDEPVIYEIQLERAVRKGFAERFGLLSLLEQANEEPTFFAEYLEQIILSLEQQTLYEITEEEYACLKRRVSAAKQLERHYGKRLLRIEEVQREARSGRTDARNASAPDEHLKEAARQCRAARDKSLQELLDAERETAAFEQYRKESERDYPHRKCALRWLRSLPSGREGIEELLRGISGEYLRAYVLQITVETPFHFVIRWFDNQTSQVILSDNPETLSQLRRFQADAWIW